MDKIRFTASANPGMALSPIDKVASGGELSRFMLAFRVALFDSAQKILLFLTRLMLELADLLQNQLVKD